MDASSGDQPLPATIETIDIARIMQALPHR